MTFSPEVLAEFAKIARAARAALHVDGVGVVTRDAERFAVADVSPGFDINGSLPDGLAESVWAARRTAIVTGEHSVALMPIFGADDVVGLLCVVRGSTSGFDGPEVANVELVARELARVVAEGGPRRLVPMEHESIADEYDLEASSVIPTQPDFNPPPLMEGGFVGFGEIAPTSLLSNEALRELLANAVTKSLQITQGHVAALVLSREEPFSVLALAATRDAPDVPSTDLISGTLVRRVFETALPVLTLDAKENEFSSVSNSVAKLSVSTVMCVPLGSQGSRANSALYCATFGIGGAYDAKSLAALMAEARMLTPLLENLGQLKGCR